MDRPPAPIASEAYDPNQKWGRPSFDHLVGALLELQWYVEPNGFGGFKIDHSFICRGLLNR